MAITEEEWDGLTDKIHAWDIRDEMDNAIDRSLFEALSNLYETAKKVLDPDRCGFDENTNDILIKLSDEADEIHSDVVDAIEKLQSIEEMLTKLTSAIPDSVFED